MSTTSTSSGWNRSTSTPKPAPKKPSAMRGVVAGLVVVALASICAVMFMGKGEKPVEKIEKERGRIKEVTPAKAPTSTVAKADEKPVRRTKKGTPIPDNVQPDARGILRYPNGQRWGDPNDLHLIPRPKVRELFKYRSENDIVVMLKADPSRMAPFLVGHRIPYGERFVADFKESLKETPLVIDKDDTPEEAELRKAAIETKMELKARMEAGEDIAKIMNDTQKELDRLCQYHDDLKQQIREAMNNPELTDQDVEDYVTAANQLLQKQGITQFTMPKFINRQARLLLMKERQEALRIKRRQEEQKGQK